jgi:inosine-uridine nucleoside N-ribohydrolase
MGVPGKPIDDGQALLYLFGRPDIELVGITTSFGNGPIDEVHGATEKLLRDLGRQEIPLVQGEGERGQAPTAAAHLLAETAAASPGEISLLALGPVGNLHAASKADPGFWDNLKQIVVMGGYLHALPGSYWGNVSELNLASNPEAAHAVLNASCPVTLMNAHVCLDAPFGLPELSRLAQWRGSSIYRSLHEWLLQCEIGPGQPGDYLWDLLPAVYVSYPELFDKHLVWIRSGVSDLETGTLIPGKEGEGAAINMPTRIQDVDRFYAILYKAWSQVPVGQIEA